jgi:hypothetical protein
MKEEVLAYKVGDTAILDITGEQVKILQVTPEGYKVEYPDGSFSRPHWWDRELGAVANPPEVEEEWRCSGGGLERSVEPPAQDDEDVLSRISHMLIMTNLAHRLGIPEPCSVDMSWDSLEYIEWVLWRCDAVVKP